MPQKSPGEGLMLIAILVMLIVGLFVVYTTRKQKPGGIITDKVKKAQTLLFFDPKKPVAYTIGSIYVGHAV